jgi:hypothetical protein
MLLYRGVSLLHGVSALQSVEVAVSIAGGMLFYLLLFSKLSLKVFKAALSCRAV